MLLQFSKIGSHKNNTITRLTEICVFWTTEKKKKSQRNFSLHYYFLELYMFFVIQQPMLILIRIKL